MWICPLFFFFFPLLCHLLYYWEKLQFYPLIKFLKISVLFLKVLKLFFLQKFCLSNILLLFQGWCWFVLVWIFHIRVSSRVNLDPMLIRMSMWLRLFNSELHSRVNWLSCFTGEGVISTCKTFFLRGLFPSPTWKTVTWLPVVWEPRR